MALRRQLEMTEVEFEQYELDLIREAVEVGRALGVALPQDYSDNRLAFIDGLPVDMTSSMHHDLERGRPLELRWFSGGVVELGAKVGVLTPANRAVHDILSLYADGPPQAPDAGGST